MKKIYLKPTVDEVGTLGLNPFMGLQSDNSQTINPGDDEPTTGEGDANLGTAWDFNEKLMLK